MSETKDPEELAKEEKLEAARKKVGSTKRAYSLHRLTSLRS